MKAWKCSTYEDIDGWLAVIVWAETPGKAKSFVVGDERLGEPEFTWIHCVRAKWADSLADMDEEKLEVEELRHGWSWQLPDGQLVDHDTVPLIEKYGGTVSDFYKTYLKQTSPIKYNENGFYEEE